MTGTKCQVITTHPVDETLAEFARRRLGAEALDKLIGPMVSGIFAGNPETMSLKSCFPRIHELEQEFGGLLKAMIKLAKQKRAEIKAGKQVASAAGPGGVLTSFVGGIQELTDATVQHPFTVYGVTKVFGEQIGAYYRRRFGLDFRGLRYPSIVGPGVKTPSVVQFTSWAIEQSARGNPFTIVATPETRVPVLYFKEAAAAMIQLADAPVEAIKTVNYLVDGVKPTPSAGELAALVGKRLPDAQITFAPDAQLQAMLDALLRPIDDSRARSEWGWAPTFDQSAIIEDFLAEMAAHPARYA